MHMVKVVVLGTRGIPDIQGGVEKHCQELYPRLAEKGCEVTVFTRKPYVVSAVNDYNGVRLVCLPCPKSKSLEAFIHTFLGVFSARRFKPDILHIHAIGPSLLIPLARLLGFKVVMTHHGPDYERKKWGKIAKAMLKLGERSAVLCANEIICVSATIADSIRKKYKRNVRVIPNGVVIREIAGSEDALKAYRLEKGKYILAVGRFVPEKGFHDLIEAFGKKAGWKLVIAGDADHEDSYSRNLKKKAKEGSDIVLTGFISGEPLHELYSYAGLFVLPSYYEGLPIALLEAMSYGLSCIASDIAGNREVRLPHDRYFPTGDIDALAKKIAEFIKKPLTDSERQEQISVIKEKYDWDKIAGRTLEVYSKLK